MLLPRLCKRQRPVAHSNAFFVSDFHRTSRVGQACNKLLDRRRGAVLVDTQGEASRRSSPFCPYWVTFRLSRDLQGVPIMHFDILVHEGRRLTELPLLECRAILSPVVEPGERVALSQVSGQPAAEMLRFVKSHGLEGAVAKRSDSVYHPGQRTGVWSCSKGSQTENRLAFRRSQVECLSSIPLQRSSCICTMTEDST
jgi:hypothetical protein